MTNSESSKLSMGMRGHRTITISTRLFCVPSLLGHQVPAQLRNPPGQQGMVMVLELLTSSAPSLPFSQPIQQTARKSVTILMLLKVVLVLNVSTDMSAIASPAAAPVRGTTLASGTRVNLKND